jgi:PEP-CTERM motif
LTNISTGTIVGDFTVSGSPLSAVLGLADDGTTMYAVDRTEIYSVNLTNAVLTPLSNYASTGLGAASGSAFINESKVIPEPSTWAMLILGFGGLGLLGLRRKHRGTLSLA